MQKKLRNKNVKYYRNRKNDVNKTENETFVFYYLHHHHFAV